MIWNDMINSLTTRASEAQIIADSPYNYIPTKSVAIIFVVLFSISTIIHVGQTITSRMWWLFPTVCLCGVLEIIGWSARLWSSISPTLQDPFLMQITTTIIAPTPLVAANFVILGRIIVRLGPEYSRLTPKRYTAFFCTCDVIALVVQAVGGALASNSLTDPNKGGHIMLGGIIFQLIIITVYAVLATEFFVRYAKQRPFRRTTGSGSGKRPHMGMRLKLMIYAMCFTTVCLFIRSVYRTAELSDGWSGRIISTQLYFNILDGAMVTLALITLNIAHPGILLKESPKQEYGMMEPKLHHHVHA